MVRRSVDWNDGLAEDLKDPKFAQQFILACLDDGLPICDVLGKVIRAYGVKEFAARIKMPSSNVIRAINSRYNPTIDTVNKLLSPFKMQVSVAPINKRKVA